MPDDMAVEKANASRVHLIWQEPCHEVFVIHHFEGYERYHPEDEAEMWRTVRALWPEYTKGMDASEYEAKLTSDHLMRARATEESFDMPTATKCTNYEIR